MGRRIPVLLLLVLVASAIISCGGQTTPQNQPTDQPAVQLSPEESQASQTVTDFLDMCKGGQIQEAIDKYEDITAGTPPLDPALFQGIFDYSILFVSIVPQGSASVVAVLAQISVKRSGGESKPNASFMLSADGQRILGR